MKDLAGYIATALVKNPDAVEVEEGEGRDDGKMIIIRVAPEDRGVIVGRQGRTVRAIQTVLNAAAHGGDRITLEIGDPED